MLTCTNIGNGARAFRHRECNGACKRFGKFCECAFGARANWQHHRVRHFARCKHLPSVHCLSLSNPNHCDVHQRSICSVAKRRNAYRHVAKSYRITQYKQLHFNWFLRRLKQLCSARDQNHYATYQRPQNQFTSTHPNLSLDQCAFVCLSTISHMRTSCRTLLIAILALIAVSCGSDASTQTTDSVNQSQSISTTDFNATLVGGGEINLQSELQKSPVALWFWAPG